MAKDRSSLSWDEGGIGMWNMPIRTQAQKAWLFNIFLANSTSSTHDFSSTWNTYNSKHYNGFKSQLFTTCSAAWNKLNSSVNPTDIRTNNCLTDNGKPIALKAIYQALLKSETKKQPTIRLTEGQKALKTLHQVDVTVEFPNVKLIKDHRGRDTTFKLLARCLPYLKDKVSSYCVSCFIKTGNIIMFAEMSQLNTTLHQLFNCHTLDPYRDTISNLYDKYINKKMVWSVKLLNLSNNEENSYSQVVYNNLTGIILNQTSAIFIIMRQRLHPTNSA